MKRRMVLWALALVLALFPVAAFADGGDGYKIPLGSPSVQQEDSGADRPVRPRAIPAEQCGTRTWDANVDAGKSPVDNWSTATDGCHTYRWNGSIGAGPAASGTVTFRVNKAAQAWELGVSPADGKFCEYSRVYDANLMFAHGFGVSDGTEVTVNYDCR